MMNTKDDKLITEITSLGVVIITRGGTTSIEREVRLAQWNLANLQAVMEKLKLHMEFNAAYNNRAADIMG